MKCQNKKCNKEHNGEFGSGLFCCRSCSNSRNFSKESNDKKSISNELPKH